MGTSLFRRRVQQSSSFPQGFCWIFCRTGECTNSSCRLKHLCAQCLKNIHHSHVKNGLLKVTELPTPVRVIKLNHFLHGYNSDLKDKLISWFSHGFKINSFIDKTREDVPPIIKVRETIQRQSLKKLAKEIQKGRVKGPFDKPPFHNFMCSPLG